VRTGRTLITVPYVARGGGVAHYYEAVRSHLGSEVEYLRIGAPSDCQPRGRRLLGAVGGNLRLACALGRSGADVVHVNPSLDWGSLLRDGLAVIVAKVMRRRVVVFFRGWPPEVERRLSGPVLAAFRAVFFRADALIVLYSGFRQSLKAWGYRGPVHVLTTVVADDSFAAIHSSAIRARCQKAGPPRLLFMARLVRDKGIYETIDAYALARDEIRELELIIAGTGPEEAGIVQAAAQRGVPASVFIGGVAGSRKLHEMLASDIFILPTAFEGMPNAVLEALALGLTVIACPAGGLQDFFVDGVLGLVAPDASPARLSDLIVKACKDANLRRELGLRGHAFAKEHFTAAVSARRLTAIYGAVRTSGTKPGAGVSEYVWYEEEIVSARLTMETAE